MSENNLMPIDKTRIETAGVMRCCLVSVAMEYTERDHPGVSIGMKSECEHCHEKFTLVDKTPHPMWTPDWIIEKNNPAQPPDKDG